MQVLVQGLGFSCGDEYLATIGGQAHHNTLHILASCCASQLTHCMSVQSICVAQYPSVSDLHIQQRLCIAKAHM